MPKFYPSIVELISPNIFPGDNFDLSGITESTLGKVSYSDFFMESSRNGEQRYYSLILGEGEDSIDIPIPGTGLILKVTGEPVIVLDFRWKILSYIKSFKSEGFAYTEKAFFDLLFEITGATKEEVLEEVIRIFIDAANPIIEFKQKLTNLNLPNTLQSIEEIIDYSDENNLNLLESIFENIIQDIASPNEILDNIELLFQKWFGDFTIEDIKKIILPSFILKTGTIGLEIEFPRKYLIPLDENNQPIEEGQPDDKSILNFTSASFLYSTDLGFQFEVDSSGADLNYSQIGNSGLTLSLDNVKLDLSRKKNIPEAVSDGRPEDFIGVYAQEVFIGLPSKWFKQDNENTLAIFGHNFLIGTGGVSGTIGLGAVATKVATLSFEMVLENGTNIKFIKQDASQTEVKNGDRVINQITQTPLQNGDYELDNSQGKISIKEEKLINFLPSDTELIFTLGKKKENSEERKGFKLGFSHFHMLWQQNSLIESSIKGSITIPKFKTCGSTEELKLNIEAFFEEDGDFRIVVDPGEEGDQDELTICFEDVFQIKIKNLEVGKDDNRIYLQITGALSFDNNDKLNTLIKKDLEVKKFRIYSDGSCELEGGSIPLPDSVVLPIGPVNISITAIHFGAHQQLHNGEMREYKYFGFDGGVSVNPGGVSARGEGVKYYFTVDEGERHSFLQLDGIGINLIIPGDVTPENATLLLEGYLAIKEHEYAGSLKFTLPQIKAGGGASMVYKPKEPSFIVDAHLELSAPIPLASTGLGIYGFRGLFGLRYLASKEIVDAANWYEYYKAPTLGVQVEKLIAPELTEGAKKPISIGAGVTIATTADEGKAFSLRLFLLLSIPNLIVLEGKANINGKRLDALSADDAPFWAMVSYSPGDSFEAGLGVNYKMPREGDDKGWILSLNASVQAAYFFNDPKSWFIHLGTKEKPIVARVVDLFNGYSYLMLSAKGIAAGAGIDFGFKRKYLGGVVKASAKVYMDVWGKVSFPSNESGNNEKTQFGAGVAVGGHLEGYVLGVGFYAGLDTVLTAEAPRPFKVYGSTHLCVTVKVWKFKKTECFDVDFIWERDRPPVLDPIYALPASLNTDINPLLASAINIFSGDTYSIDYFGTSMGTISSDPIPLNSYIELQFKKAVLPGLIGDKIGGFTNEAEDYQDIVPPVSGVYQISHQYKVSAIDLEIKHNGTWKPYHPYQAMLPEDRWHEVAHFKIGYWQKTGKEYNKLRLLAQSPFSYTQIGQPEWYIPEQWGLTPTTLFCSGQHREYICLGWRNSPISENVPNQIYNLNGGASVAFVGSGGSMYNLNYLSLNHPGRLMFFLDEPAPNLKINLLNTSAYQVTIQFYAAEYHSVTGEFQNHILVKTVVKNYEEFPCEIIYDWEDAQTPIVRVDVAPLECDEDKISEYESTITSLSSSPNDFSIPIKILKAKVIIERSKCCLPHIIYNGSNSVGSLLLFYKQHLEEQLQSCQEQQVQNTQAAFDACENRGIIRQASGSFLIPFGLSFQDFWSCWNAQQLVAETIAQCEAIEQEISYIDFLLSLTGIKPDASCVTLISSICWMSQEDYNYNQTIPGQEALSADYQTMIQAMNHEVVPIWRPNSEFRVKVTVADLVNNTQNHTRTVYFGFRTGEPLGHFSLGSTNTSNDNLYSDTKESPEDRLRFYIDFEKSYPNADGNILYAKPMYYVDPKLLIFFKPKYTHHFFQRWEALYSGMSTPEYRLDVRIKDPLEGNGDLNAPGGLIINEEELPLSEYLGLDGELQHDQELSIEMQLIQNLANDQICIGNLEQIQPTQRYITITAENLMPLKLYAAVVSNIKNNSVAGEVHSYNFQTSRYANFEEHIQSFSMEDKEDSVRNAVFLLPQNLTDNLILQTWQMIQNPEDASQDLINQYPDVFDRITIGLLKMPPITPPSCTELNWIIKPLSKGTYIFLIRSPEPFNDPKMPSEVLQETVRVFKDGVEDLSFKKVFSRDGTQVLLMKGIDWFFAGEYSFEFKYMLWNGSVYEEIATSTILM